MVEKQRVWLHHRISVNAQQCNVPIIMVSQGVTRIRRWNALTIDKIVKYIIVNYYGTNSKLHSRRILIKLLLLSGHNLG